MDAMDILENLGKGLEPDELLGDETNNLLDFDMILPVGNEEEISQNAEVVELLDFSPLNNNEIAQVADSHGSLDGQEPSCTAQENQATVKEVLMALYTNFSML